MQDIFSLSIYDYESSLPCIETCFNASNDTVHQELENQSSHQNPQPQIDALNLHLPGTISASFAEVGGSGDVHEAERDNTESLALELSEEDLSHGATVYKATVEASANVTTSAIGRINTVTGDMFSSELGSQMDWVSYYLSTVKSSHQGCFEREAGSFSQEPLHSNTLTCNDGLCKSVSKSFMKEDETLAGSDSIPNTSSIHSKKSHCDINESVTELVTDKTHSQRPSALGSSPSNDYRIPEILNPHANASFVSRRSSHCSRSKSHTGKSNSAVLNQTNKVEQCKGDNSNVSKQSLVQRMESVSPKAYSKFCIYNASNLAYANSRGSVVRKESDLQKSPSYAPVPHIVDTKSSRPMSTAQRLSRSKGGATTELNKTIKLADSHSHSSQPRQRSDICGEVQQNAGDKAVLQASVKSDNGFPSLANPEAFFNRESRSRSKDHRSDVCSSDTSDSEVSNSPDCTSAQNRYTPNQEQDIHHSEHQDIISHPSSDGQYVSCPCTPAAFTQNTSPCVSEWSNFSYAKETSNFLNDFISTSDIQQSPGEGYQLNLENQITTHKDQHRLYIEASDLVKDQTAAVTDLLHSELPATSSFGASASFFMGDNHPSDMSDILENFPSFSSKLFEEKATNASTCGRSAAGEIRYFYKCLEKERFRRKHCEERILKQDTKLLEVQQQLAVAISTGKRKDVMVEQLDKQLAKFVEGWKKKESEKDEHIRVLKQEKQNTDETLQSLQTMIRDLEHELSQSVQALSKEKSDSAQAIESLQQEICQAQKDLNLAEQSLRQEQQKLAAVVDELNQLKESKEVTEKRALEAEDQLIKEQERALKKEQELVEKINMMTEANQKMDLRLKNLEEENEKHKEIEIQNELLKNELQKSIQAVEQLIKEEEEQNAEVVDMKAKFQDAQEKLEKDVCAQMEKKIADQATEFYSRMERSLEEAAACHAKQVEELNAKHQHDLEQQVQVLNVELLTLEGHYQQQLKEVEERLQVLTTENTLLKESEAQIESQRMEVLNKLQAMMQLQWNEAVSLLADTPQQKRSPSSPLSHQDSNHLAVDEITPAPSLSPDLPMPQLMLSQANDDKSAQDVLPCRYALSASPAALEVRENLHTSIGVEESLKKFGDYQTLSMKGNELRFPERGQVSHHSSPSFVTPKSGSQQSCCRQPQNFYNQSDLNNGKGLFTNHKRMNSMPVSGGSHREQGRFRYHTSMMSPQKPTLQCRSESSQSVVKSWSQLPPVSRNSHILKDNHTREGLVTSHHLTGFKPNYSPRRSHPQPALCASVVSEAVGALARGSDDYKDIKHDGGTNEASILANREKLEQSHVSLSDSSSGFCGSTSHQTNQSPACDETVENEKHRDLQHYIKMLLNNDGSSMSSDSDSSMNMSEAGLRESVEDLAGNYCEHASEVELKPCQSQLRDTSVNQLLRDAPVGSSNTQFAPDTNLPKRGCFDHRSAFVEDRGNNSAQGRLEVSPVFTSCSMAKSSVQDDSQTQRMKCSSNPQTARKSLHVSKAKKKIAESQSANTALIMSDKHMDTTVGSHRLPQRKSFIH